MDPDEYRRRETGRQAARNALAAREEYQARRAAREVRNADEELAGQLAYEAAAGHPARFRAALPDAGLLARFPSPRTRFW